MRPSRIQAIDHVTLEAPPGLRDELRWFYTKIAELEEVPQTGPEAPRLCLKSARIELRINLVEHPRVDSIGCRATILVTSLKETLECLEERNVGCQQVSGVVYTDRRVAVLDPAGNRVELKQEWPPFYS